MNKSHGEQHTDRLLSADFLGIFLLKSDGGSAWESNPPIELFTRCTGFEVREGHQCPFRFQTIYKSFSFFVKMKYNKGFYT